jgi:hypothetical protein
MLKNYVMELLIENTGQWLTSAVRSARFQAGKTDNMHGPMTLNCRCHAETIRQPPSTVHLRILHKFNDAFSNYIDCRADFNLPGGRVWRSLTVFCDTVPCSLVDIVRRFRRAYCLHQQGDKRRNDRRFRACLLLTWWWMQKKFLKCLSVSASLQCAASQQIATFILIAVRTSYLTTLHWFAKAVRHDRSAHYCSAIRN